MTSDSDNTQDEEGTLHTILIVEDDENIGEFISEAIKEETPYHPLHVTNAAQALEAVQSVTPSVVLLDYDLPGIDGLELADRLHALPGLETVPTMMVSASHPPRKAMQQRHIIFLAKPFDLTTLIKTINTLLAEQTA